MGLFLQTAILPGCTEEQAANAVAALAKRRTSYGLEVSGCKFSSNPKGVQILFNDECAGFDSLSKALSKQTGTPVMLLYIYDGDLWGYFFSENGKVVDSFNTIPDYFDDGDEPDDPDTALIADRFGVPEEDVAPYLVIWTGEDVEEEHKAFPDDECGAGDCWQMADFMEKLGWPYPW